VSFRAAAPDHRAETAYAYSVQSAQARVVRPKSYSDNFRYDRVGRWTH
jgi:hypothetical protein